MEPTASADDYPELTALARVTNRVGHEAAKALAEIDRWRHADEDVQKVYDIMLKED